MNNKLVIGLTIAVAIGIGSYAFAHMGGGYGYYEGMHGGPGMHHGYYDESGYGYPGNLTDEDIQALEAERSVFFKETEDIRRNLYSKELELRSELYKKNPDASKAEALQKEVSELGSKLDQKRIDHMIKMRKLNPNVGGEYMGEYHMGYGNSFLESCWR